MIDYRLYLILDRASVPDDRLLSVAEAAFAGGVTLVQWRDKTGRSVGDLLAGVATLAQRYGVPLIINDDAKLALAVGAAGVHLGQGDGDPVAARTLLGPQAIIGRSVANDDHARRVAAEPIDYVGIGPAYATATKSDHAEPLGPAGIARLRAMLPQLPAVAIGGIDLARLADVLTAGIDGVAIVSAICRAAEPRLAAQNLIQNIKKVI